jgi:FkbM family methyltransferase
MTFCKKTDSNGVQWLWPENDNGCWEGLNNWIDVPDILMTYVDTKNVIVQAGGNCGLYVKKYAENFKTVYTFEPVSELFECLVHNVPHKNVIKIQACLGDSHKLVDIKPHEFGNIGGGHVCDGKSIPTFLIDDLELEECNLIQLDIEGYEYNALLGARKTLSKCKPVVCIENCEKWLVRYNTNLNHIETFLYSFGYSFVGCARGDRIYKIIN